MAAPVSLYNELYRESNFGWSLVDTLDEQIQEGNIPPQLAVRILGIFDRFVADALQSVQSRLTFKGNLSTYRFCEDKWTFDLKNVTFKLNGGNQQITADKVKIKSQNSKKPGEV